MSIYAKSLEFIPHFPQSPRRPASTANVNGQRLHVQNQRPPSARPEPRPASSITNASASPALYISAKLAENVASSPKPKRRSSACYACACADFPVQVFFARLHAGQNYRRPASRPAPTRNTINGQHQQPPSARPEPTANVCTSSVNGQHRPSASRHQLLPAPAPLTRTPRAFFLMNHKRLQLSLKYRAYFWPWRWRRITSASIDEQNQRQAASAANFSF